jgi:hypothetical protein
VSTHRRDLTEGRATMDAIATADDSADPGIFATVELAWALLYDADLGLGGHFAQLKLASEGELSTDAEKTSGSRSGRSQCSATRTCTAA